MLFFARKFLAPVVLAMAAIGAAAPAAADTVEVQMLTKGPDGERNVFSPAVVRIQPGDTVRFVSAQPGHNAQSVRGMTPEGGEEFRTALNKTEEVTFESEGVYGYKCLPHYGLGMVGLVVVGDPVNLGAVEDKAGSTPPKAKERFATYLSEIE